ncbi:MAG: beta-propeller fold lactonase family protein [Terriglobales bacterium]
MKWKLSFAVVVIFVFGFTSLPVFAASATGAVYTLTNASSGNAVMVFARASDGHLSSAGMFPTGGNGSGAGLASQGALAMDAENNFLFAVNAGSNSVSVFKITANGLRLVDTEPSGGQEPISLTVSHNVLYVLNDGGAVGGSDTIAGFTVNTNGHIKPLVSGQPLSATSVGPAEVAFSVDGDLLLVTEKNTNNIDVFKLDDDGVAIGPTVVPSSGETPYGFAFGKRDQVFVSDAVGGGASAGAISSYAVSSSGLKTVSGSAADNQTAPCWVVVTNDGQFIYTTNTGTGTISGYSAAFSGVLRLLNANGQTASTGSGSGPLDAAISNDNRFLYVLTPGTANLQGFTIAADGSLTFVSQATGIPSSAGGLVAR